MALPGTNVSLLNNFNASAIACKSPYKPTLLGPRRRCILANIFRSNTVKKATANKIGIIIGKILIKFILKKIYNNYYY